MMTLRPMRRSRQQLSNEECVEILERNSNGVLALTGDEGYPYAVPLSYVFKDGKIFVHSATAGHKIDAIRRDSRASFCVIDLDDVHPSTFTTIYRSVIAFGTVRIIEDEAGKRQALDDLSDKYCPDEPLTARHAEINRSINRLIILEMIIEAFSGKHSKELIPLFK